MFNTGHGHNLPHEEHHKDLKRRRPNPNKGHEHYDTGHSRLNVILSILVAEEDDDAGGESPDEEDEGEEEEGVAEGAPVAVEVGLELHLVLEVYVGSAV